MGQTLAADITEDFVNVFLDTEHFATTVSYTPKGGSARTITVQLSGINAGVRHESHHVTNEREIVVACRRDATYGITDPRVGDKLVYQSETYNFDGVSGESATEFFIRFKTVDREYTGNMSAMRN